MRCLGSVSGRTRPWQRLVATLLLLLLLTVTGCQGNPARLCRGIHCFNGGSLEVHGSLWGGCRCVCPRGFAGMTCQYVRLSKRTEQRQALVDAEQLRHFVELRDILLEMDRLAQSLPAARPPYR